MTTCFILSLPPLSASFILILVNLVLLPATPPGCFKMPPFTPSTPPSLVFVSFQKCSCFFPYASFWSHVQGKAGPVQILWPPAEILPIQAILLPPGLLVLGLHRGWVAHLWALIPEWENHPGAINGDASAVFKWAVLTPTLSTHPAFSWLFLSAV